MCAGGGGTWAYFAASDTRVLQIKLDLNKISALQLSVTTASVAHAILNTPKLKLKPSHVQVRSCRAASGVCGH